MTRQVHDTAWRERRLKELRVEIEAHIKSAPKKALCHDCGVSEGEIHEYGCEQEVCPFCGESAFIGCDCMYKVIEAPFSDVWEEDIDELSTRLGVSRDEIKKIQDALFDIQYDKWQAAIEKKGRVPFVSYPHICARCGELWPDFFTVPNEEWERYIQPDMRRSILCRGCYDEIKALIDNAEKLRALSGQIKDSTKNLPRRAMKPEVRSNHDAER